VQNRAYTTVQKEIIINVGDSMQDVINKYNLQDGIREKKTEYKNAVAEIKKEYGL
jgi:hypothetical protein